MLLKTLALVLPLGIDTLIVAVSLGAVRASGSRGTWKVAAAFASAEAVMPLVGLMVGKSAGRLIGAWAPLMGGVLLIGIAAWMLFFDDDDEKSDGTLHGFALATAALSVSIDELAVGFSIGLMGVPIILTIVLIGVQAFLFTWIGVTFGHKLAPLFGEKTEKAVAFVFAALGSWVIVEGLVQAFR